MQPGRLPTLASTTTSTTTSSTTTTSTIPATTTTTTIAPTTTAAPVVGDHMVFADGYPLGHISPAGFAAYQGDAVIAAAPGLHPGLVRRQLRRFAVQRPGPPPRSVGDLGVVSDRRAAARCRQRRAAGPVGRGPELAVAAADRSTPVPLDDPTVTAVIQLITTNDGVSPAPPPQRGSAVLVDLIGDGVPDLVVSATFSDHDVGVYYRLVAVAADGNPDDATTVMIEFGGSLPRRRLARPPVAGRAARRRGRRDDGQPSPFELFIRRTTANTKRCDDP